MKQKQVKRICAMLMAGLMAAGCLAGCGNTETNNASSDAASTGAATSSEATTSTDAAASSDAAAEGPWKPEIPNGPFTIDIYGLMGWEVVDGTNGADLYFFKYMENWLREEGYDVTFNVDMAWDWDEGAEQFKLMCGTDTLPDLHIHRVEAPVQSTFGWAEDMFMDWTPYMNETNMPNAMKAIAEVGNPINPEVMPNGEYYEFNLPGERSGSVLQPDVSAAFINQAMMKDAGFDEMPTNTADMEALLYAMKANAADPANFWSLSYRGYMFTNYYFWGPAQMWTYPNTTWGSKYFLTADGDCVYGALTDVWDDYVSTYNKWINDGIMHPDALTLDNTTKAAMCAEGQFGVYCCYTMADVYGSDPTREEWENWKLGLPLTNSETGKTPIWNLPCISGGGDMGWTISNDSEYKDILVYLADHMCTPEASFMTIYGPKAGEDPLNLVQGWTEFDPVAGEPVAPEGYETWLKYQQSNIVGWCAQGFLSNGVTWRQYMADQFGTELKYTQHTATDVITGKTITTTDYTAAPSYDEVPDDQKTAIAWTNETNNALKNNITEVYVTDVYMDADTQLRADELQLLISEHCTSEGAKFVTGGRPIDQIPQFKEEIKALGAEELQDIYREATLSYRQSIWGDSITK